MLPVILAPHAVRVGLAGSGDALKRRLGILDQAGILAREVYEDRVPSPEELARLNVLFVAGFDESASRELAAAARRAGVLVNVEDVPKLCDFHVPAQIRRGDLLFTISTGGRSPGLSRVLREVLEASFGQEWENRLDELATARARWRASGLGPDQVAAETRSFLEHKGWLA
jgi:precorrin-2 dehydrogenase/sirohydrochlorin ferrochelatase